MTFSSAHSLDVLSQAYHQGFGSVGELRKVSFSPGGVKLEFALSACTAAAGAKPSVAPGVELCPLVVSPWNLGTGEIQKFFQKIWCGMES